VIALKDDEFSTIFKSLGHPIRRKILDILKNGPRTTGDLVDHFPEVSRYATMKHLAALDEANLILIRREGRNRLNYINTVPLQQLHNRWVSQYQSNLATSLLSLKHDLERGNNAMGYKHDSFQIEQEIIINANREKVFKSLTENINQWWAYRLCGKNSTLSLDPRVGGQFLEDAGNGKGAIWGVITFINAPAEIRLNGLLGMQGAVNSAYSYQLEERNSQTVLKLSHDAVGLLDPEWENSHREGWKELLGTFLKQFVEENKLPEQG
jgi:DNA-binding transcriptional ArsR family regulator/uncharacterized protein YndB with AHSA1/START domain